MKKMFNIKTPSNIYLWWNFGSMIFMMMTIQMITGIILSMYYMSLNNPFDSSVNIYMNMNFGWLTRLMHSNLTSMLFILLIIHITRNIMFNSLFNFKMWMTGMLSLLLMMMEAFVGYSLVWNQMSYWAMMVITNFISALPIVGTNLVKLIWGNFNINIILINRFLSIHFLVPAAITINSFIHLMILHMNKSNNPMGINNKTDLIKLNPLFIIKDNLLMMMALMMLMNILLIYPYVFYNNDNFVMMNYFKTPSHIEPEWYFLFFYSILRSINNKLSGLIMLILSIMMIFILPLIELNKMQLSNKLKKISNIMFMMLMMLMSIMGTKTVEYPFNTMNMTLLYLWLMLFPTKLMINKLN